MKYIDCIRVLAVIIIVFCGSVIKTLIPFWSKGLPIGWSIETFEWSFSITAILAVALVVIVIFNKK